jgi:hypothetical protein
LRWSASPRQDSVAATERGAPLTPIIVDRRAIDRVARRRLV